MAVSQPPAEVGPLAIVPLGYEKHDADESDVDSLLTSVQYGRQEESRYIASHTLKSSSQQSVVAFGVTGHGKSTFLNFILRRKRFESSQGLFGALISVTKVAESESITVEGRQLLLIDTPGFMDTQQIEDSENRSANETVQTESEDFKKNILHAYLEAGEEVAAFVLVYSLTARWSFDVTQMTNFLKSLSFPWNHCIIVLTHGDHPFKGKTEDERYEELTEAMAKEVLPKQLKKLIKDSSDRVVIVESTRPEDDNYYRNVMKKLLDQINDILKENRGPFKNPHFLRFAKKCRKSREEEYKALLEHRFLDGLEAETKDDFKKFKPVGAEIAKVQTEFIGHLHKVAEMFDNKTFTPGVAAAAGFGAAAIAAGVVATVVGVGLIPATLGFSVAAVGVGIGSIAGGVAVATGGVGLASLPPIVKKLKNRLEIKKAQASYDKAIKAVERLYELYEQIMKEIKRSNIASDHNVDLLFAHLAGVHMHDRKVNGENLCKQAENLAIYHKIRKQAKVADLTQPDDKKDSDATVASSTASFALPVGFNLLARGFDVAHTIGATVEVTQVSKKSKEADTRLLRDSCIAILENEMHTIMKLCNVPKQ